MELQVGLSGTAVGSWSMPDLDDEKAIEPNDEESDE